MTEWIVHRWARYGHERLYAEMPEGTALGYFDVKSGAFHCADEANLPLLRRAIADHLGNANPPVPAKRPAGPSDQRSALAPSPVPMSEAIWHDLSTTRAGAAARDPALAARDAEGTLRHLLSRFVGARTEELAWRIGADGEQAVAAQLAKLPADWRVLHAVPVGQRGADIDHLVIGPGGVYTVNAKHHPDASIWVGGDTFMVNGQRVPYVRNSRHEARRASSLLSERVGVEVTATGVIAVMGARKGFKVREQPKDGTVVVVKRRQIRCYLESQPLRLTPDEVNTIFDVARRSTTWEC